MTPLEDAENQAEKLFRRLLDEAGPEAANAFQEAARLLLECRTGERKVRYRKLILENGEPISSPKSA